MFGFPTFLPLFLLAGSQNAGHIPIDFVHQICAVPVEVNGKTMRFIVDTGSYRTFLLRPAKDLGIENDAAASVRIGSHAWSGVKLDVLDSEALRQGWLDSFDGKIDGVLGVDLLHDVGFALDVKGRYVQIFDKDESDFSDFWAPQSDRPDAKNLKVGSCPLIKNNVGTYWSPVVIDNVAHFATIDSGAMNCQFAAAELDSIASKGFGAFYQSISIYGRSATLGYKVSKVNIAGLGVPFPVMALRSPDLIGPGYVGMELIAETKVVWDFPHGKIYFQPNSDQKFKVNSEPKSTSDVAVSPYGDVVPLLPGKTYLHPDWLAPMHTDADLVPVTYGGFTVVASGAALPSPPPLKSPRKVHRTMNLADEVYIVFNDGSIRVVKKDGTAFWKYQPAGSETGTK